jgi:hypothetical protein
MCHFSKYDNATHLLVDYQELPTRGDSSGGFFGHNSTRCGWIGILHKLERSSPALVRRRFSERSFQSAQGMHKFAPINFGELEKTILPAIQRA